MENTQRQFTKMETPSTLRFIRAGDLEKSGTKGVVVEGVYVEPLTNKYNESNFDYKFQLEDGSFVIINHAGHLAYLMKNVAPGTLVQVSYLGSEVIASGNRKGKTAHKFSLAIADE